jgi:hypothetical protein
MAGIRVIEAFDFKHHHPRDRCGRPRRFSGLFRARLRQSSIPLADVNRVER